MPSGGWPPLRTVAAFASRICWSRGFRRRAFEDIGGMQQLPRRTRNSVHLPHHASKRAATFLNISRTCWELPPRRAAVSPVALRSVSPVVLMVLIVVAR